MRLRRRESIEDAVFYPPPPGHVLVMEPSPHAVVMLVQWVTAKPIKVRGPNGDVLWTDGRRIRGNVPSKVHALAEPWASRTLMRTIAYPPHQDFTLCGRPVPGPGGRSAVTTFQEQREHEEAHGVDVCRWCGLSRGALIDSVHLLRCVPGLECKLCLERL